jgi:hypothetical protein
VEYHGIPQRIYTELTGQTPLVPPPPHSPKEADQLLEIRALREARPINTTQLGWQIHVAPPLTPCEVAQLPPAWRCTVGGNGRLDPIALTLPVDGGVECFFGCSQHFASFQDAASHAGGTGPARGVVDGLKYWTG